MMQVSFETLKREKSLSDRVAEQIQNLITASELRPGDSLPPQRELAEQFGVSRTVIREAIKALQAKGLVEIRAGSRVRVTAINPKQISESIDLFLRLESNQISYPHMAELRNLLEIEIAAMAAQRAESKDLERMEKEIRRMEHLRDRITTYKEAREEFARADVNFHLAVAAATKNPLLPILFKPLIDILVKQRLEAIDRPGALEEGMLYHHEIFQAIKAGDPEQARRAMRDHLEQAIRVMAMVEGWQTDKS